MQSSGTAKRKAPARRRKKALRHNVTSAAADLPRCCICGRPLARLPASMVTTGAGADRFQCSDCFYPGTGHDARRSEIIASERTRWYADLIGGSTEATVEPTSGD